MFVVESVVFTFYFVNIARVLASWMLTTQIATARNSNLLEAEKTLSIKNDLSDDLIREVTSVNRMIRYFLFAYYLTGIPMLVQNAILWQKSVFELPLPTLMLVNLGIFTFLFIII